VFFKACDNHWGRSERSFVHAVTAVGAAAHAAGDMAVYSKPHGVWLSKRTAHYVSGHA
jgi:hypothetical protein